jgi:hypothetical protein
MDCISDAHAADVHVCSDEQMHGVGSQCAERIFERYRCVRIVEQNDFANARAALRRSL